MKRLGWALFVLIIIYFIFFIRQDIIDNLELKRDVLKAAKSLAREEELAEKLKQGLKLAEDKNYIEQLARTKLGLVKSGETAYKVIR